MARTKDVNKSQAVRDYLKQNPTAKAKEVVEGLSENGITVSEGLVYAVKGALKERKQRKKRVMKAANAASDHAGNGAVGKNDPITLIRDVRELAMRAGGYQKLKQLVDALVG